MKYRADIDGLRAVAIISVIGFHAFPNLLKGGFVGVDIFFVISGYLITTIIYQEISRGIFSLKDFYARRIKRIFPSLLLVLISTLIFGGIVLLSEEYKQIGKHVLSGSTFIANFIFWKESGYFDEIADKKPLLHLWSLAIEEQYYLIWPLLILFFWQKNVNFLVVMIAVAVASFMLNVITIHKNMSTAFFLPHTRFWELLIGSIAAYLQINSNKYLRYLYLWRRDDFSVTHRCFFRYDLNRICYEAPSIIGSLLVLGSIFFITKDFQFPGYWAILPTIGTALLILSHQDAWVNKILISHKILVWIGLISFPLYLWHWPILSFAKIIDGEELSLPVRSICLAISFILAYLTYRFIEKQIRPAKNKKIILLLIALMIITGMSGYYVFKKDGLGIRIQSNELILKQFEWNNSFNKSKECLEHYPGDDYCNISTLNSAPDVAIIGDSHANHFYWGLSEYYKEKNMNVINMGAGGCPPLIGISMNGANTSLNCYSRMKPIFDLILSDKSIKTVYISFWHNAYFESRLIYSDNLGIIKEKNNYEFFFKALERTIIQLRSREKRVILIYDLPDLKENIKNCFLTRPIFPQKKCHFDNSIFVDDYKQYDQLITDLVNRNNLEIFDTKKFINGNFPINKDGIPMYRDYSHLSINGSLFFKDKYMH